MRHDHEHIQSLLAQLGSELQATLAHEKLPAAPLVHLFDRLREQMEDHMRWEEEELLPAMERSVPAFRLGPGRALRHDHEDIRRLQAIAAKHLHADPLTRSGLCRATEVVQHVLAILRVHERTEAAYILAAREGAP